jgi:predicted nucleotidyltransferase
MISLESTIKFKLKELEDLHTIRIVFACESGSRAWGFPSPDSDYDVRFIYLHSKDWYLSIYEEKDVLEIPVNKELDISGWELRKAFRLLAKRNSILFEWLQSPIAYVIDKEFLKEFSHVAHTCFSPMSGMHHYLSSAKKYYEECLSDQVKLKKYLYCLRCTLAAEWIAQYQTIPPMEISKLIPIMTDQKVKAITLKLIDLKAVQEESYLHLQEPLLNEYLSQAIEKCSIIASMLPSPKLDKDQLNASFRNMIKKYES